MSEGSYHERSILEHVYGYGLNCFETLETEGGGGGPVSRHKWLDADFHLDPHFQLKSGRYTEVFVSVYKKLDFSNLPNY
jgi:hypothetical protein